MCDQGDSDEATIVDRNPVHRSVYIREVIAFPRLRPDPSVANSQTNETAIGLVLLPAGGSVLHAYFSSSSYGQPNGSRTKIRPFARSKLYAPHP